MPSGARLVVSTRSAGVRATRTDTRSATASTRCSQLSRISSAGAVPDLVDDPADQVGAPSRSAGESVGDRLPNAQRVADLDRDALGRRHAGELDEVHDRLLGQAAHQVREPGLAEAAGTDDRRHPGGTDHRSQGRDVAVPPDQPGGVVAEPLSHRVVAGQQLGVQRLQAPGRGRRPAGRRGRRGRPRSARARPVRRARRRSQRSSAATTSSSGVGSGGAGVGRAGVAKGGPLEEWQRGGVLPPLRPAEALSGRSAHASTSTEGSAQPVTARRVRSITSGLVAARARETTTCSALIGLAGTSSPQISRSAPPRDSPRGPASARPRSSAWVRSPGTAPAVPA